MDECDEPRVRNQKWCADHKRAYAAMYASAKKRDQLTSFKETMADADSCKCAMREYCASSPVGVRWGKKKVVDWVQYQQTHGRRSYDGDLEGERPMTEIEFLHWAQGTKRLTAQGARKWWTELEDSSSTRRDNKGRDPEGNLGKLRLWVPSEEMHEKKKGRFGETAVQEGSRQHKNLDQDCVNELKDFAGVKALDEDFLRGTQLSSKDPKDTPGMFSSAEPSTPVRLRERKPAREAGRHRPGETKGPG